MKPLSLLLTLSLCAWAADMWQSKSYTEWSDKDIQKLLNNSPWSKEVSVTMSGGGGGGTTRGASRKGGGGGDVGGDTPMSGPATGNGGNNANGKAGIQEMAAPGGGSAPALTLVVRWQTALPIREAVVKQKFGSDAATSPDGKKMIEESQQFYAVMISGLPGRMAHGGDQMKAALLENTTLSVKGKDPIVAKDVQMGGNEKAAVLMFLFPKTAPIDADDKEVEFSSKLGPLMVKQKFKLKDMMFNGKLEL